MAEDSRIGLTIGIPTYNRCHSLQRAVESALSQTYPNSRIVISDNASTDDTEGYCLRVSEGHGRVRYIRQTSNLGPTANFVSCLRNSESQYFMWLSDDDWIEPDYAARCIAELEKNCDLALVAGSTFHHDSDGNIARAKPTTLTQVSGMARLLDYFSGALHANEIFYGVYRREVLERVVFPNRIAGDWHLVASVVFQGMVKTIEGVSIHRQRGGTSVSIGKMVETLGLPRYRAVAPFLWVATDETCDVIRGEPPFERMAPFERAGLGLGVFVTIFHRHVVIGSLNRVLFSLGVGALGLDRYRRWRKKLPW